MILVAIPMRNYAKGVNRLLDFWESVDVPHKVLVINDKSIPREINPIRKRARVLDVPDDFEPGLRWAYKTAAICAELEGVRFVLSCESDMEPNVETLQAMCQALELYDDLAAVAARYIHPRTGAPCYPSQGEVTGFCTDPNLGRWRWQKDLPFAFTLWRTEALAEIDDSMPHFFFDGPLGKKLKALGYRFLELLDYTTGHIGGGKQTRKSQKQYR